MGKPGVVSLKTGGPVDDRPGGNVVPGTGGIVVTVHIHFHNT